ncbi:MAG: insulinase family protein [Kofleriaceae bacterium]
MKAVVALALIAGCHVDERFNTLHMTQPHVDDPGKVTAWTLKNGMRVAIYRDPRARVTSIDLRYEVGTSDDPYGHPGYALLTGYAVVAAAAHVPDVELTTALAVDLDRTEITTTTTDLEGALAMAAKRMQLDCDAISVDAIKKHAMDQLNAIPPSFLQAVWGTAHPYAHELGNQDVGGYDAAAVCGFYKQHYAPSAATLVITGAMPEDVASKIGAAFDLIPEVKLPARPAVPAMTPTKQRVRSVVWGLGKPTAAWAIPMPALGDQDDVAVELAIRRLDEYATKHKAQLHTAIVGARRARVLVVGIEADKESELAAAHDKLHDVLAEANAADPLDGAVADDLLGDAATMDDLFQRGDRIAELVATGRRLDLLRRGRAFTSGEDRSFMRLHFVDGPMRIMDLIPAVANQGSSIENLADGPQFADRSLAGAFATDAADPGAAAVPEIKRATEEYTLANGLHVVLSSDPIASLVDVRLVFPVGTSSEVAPGLAVRAAAELQVDDGWHAGGPDAHDRVEWFGTSATEHSDVDVTRVSTHFRSSGFAVLGDWHLWAVAWHVIEGSYEYVPLYPWKRYYGPQHATLIVSGGFDAKVAKPIIERWYGPWKQSAEPVPKGMPHHGRRAITYDANETQESIELELAYGPEAHPGERARGAAQILATLIQQRLALSLRSAASVGVTFDVRDRRMLLTAQIDPDTAAETTKVLAAELAQVRASGAAQAEIAKARRRAVAQLLAAEVGVTGRAQQLEANAVQKLAPNDQSLLAEIQAVTVDDVTDAAQQLIDPATLEVTIKALKKDVDPVLNALGFDPKQAERR